MASRTVRLDDETEKVLQGIRQATGLSVSMALKKGVLALANEVAAEATQTPYEIYKQLDLGPGGYSLAPSTEARKGVREALGKKWKR